MSDRSQVAPDRAVAIIGCGKMGEAILKGWLASDEGIAATCTANSFTIVQPDDAQRERQVAQYGVTAVVDVASLAQSENGHTPFDMVVFAVKPQQMSEVLADVCRLRASGVVDASTLFITIAAGIPTSAFEKALLQGVDAHGALLVTNDFSASAQEAPRVVRVMPNMPLQVGMGASVVAGGANATDADVELVRALFAALGECFVVDEEQIDAVCAISGGGPAYFCYLVEALGEAGRELGLDPDMASRLALATLGGTYHAVMASDVTPAQMRESVCSPGGTTLAALASFDTDGFVPMVVRAMEAAVMRAEELKDNA